MRAVVLVVLVFAAFDTLHSFNVTVHDATNQFYLTSDLSITFNVDKASGNEKDTLTITNATAIQTGVDNGTERIVYYMFQVNQKTASFVKSLELNLEMKRSSDGARSFVEEFTVAATFDNSTILANWTGIPLTFVVRPPRFPHFQVKTDWQYRCPVRLQLQMCHVLNGTCINDEPLRYVSVAISLSDTRFNGGKPADHNYADKVEDCPLAYETRQDIGIACIVAFWSIALAVALWGIVKFLLKRHRKRND